MITIAFFVSLADTAPNTQNISSGERQVKFTAQWGAGGRGGESARNHSVCLPTVGRIHAQCKARLSSHSLAVRSPKTASNLCRLLLRPLGPEDDSAVAPPREGGRAKAFSLYHNYCDYCQRRLLPPTSSRKFSSLIILKI